MDIVDKISTGAIKHKHTYDWDSGQCGSLLTVYRQVGYFHCAANCVINSLCTESIDRSPGDRVCQRVFAWLFSFASPVSITGSLTVQGHWMSVSLVFLLSPYPRLHRVQSCREALWITVHSCSPVSCSVPGSLTLSVAYTLQQGFPCGYAIHWPYYNPSD